MINDNLFDGFSESSLKQSEQAFERAIQQNLLEYQDKAYYVQLLSKLEENEGLKALERDLKNAKLSKDKRLQLEQEYNQKRAQIEEQAAKAASIYRKNVYMNASKQMKAQILQQNRDTLKSEIKNIEEKFAHEMALIEASNEQAEEKAQHLLEKESQLADIRKDINKQIAENYKENLEAQTAQVNKNLKKLNFKGMSAAAKKELEIANDEMNRLIEQYESATDPREKEKYKEDMKAAFVNAAKAGLKDAGAAIGSQISNDINKSFKEAETMLTTYQSHIDARLQGSQKNYDDMMGMITTNLSISPYVQTQKVIENMKKAVDQGISYNVEQRSFLNTVADKIANTFDAFDSNLTRLIKLQQADSTAARLGMEASLTKFFNNMFEDTSYLSGLSDSVAAAIIDANSQLDRNQSAEFEYVVQKWLGSLSSLGMSDNTVSSIAQGLNYLGTGNVTALANNSSLQTLFAMSSAKAGLEYSDLLLNGLNADNTNKLLQSMIEYLKEIAENSDSQVVKAAYGDIFNMSLSDMKAISNLSSSDIANISNSMLTYSGMQNELNWQFNNIHSRVNLAEQLSNLYNNAIFGIAQDMVSNPITFAMTKMLDFMESNNIDMAIPFVNAAGFGLDLNTSVQDIMRLGMGISQAMSLMGNIMGGIGAGGGLQLDAWDATETTQRGSGLTFSTASRLGGSTGSTYVGSGNMADMKSSALNTAVDDAEESAEVTNKNHQAEYTIVDLYKAIVGELATDFVKTRDTLFELVYNSGDNFLSVRDTRMNVEEGLLQTQDSKLYELLKTGLTVTLNKDAQINIKKETLVEAFKEAMGISEKEDIQNIGDLIDGLKDGSIVVNITNPTGTKLQVDTELSGTSGYVSQINW